ncbi:arginase family protein [Colletotrichum scovillei]|uniref:Arginase family protein n=1 Tax=Colletotrichum scovillei TaxID=1209932 RepID=A0A9P7QUE4_9PEZI|nr:arginase family protein [Colletotrichum scovillei]KAG7042344.1 arginase family protein [Colletotrichum scovillei]
MSDDIPSPRSSATSSRSWKTLRKRVKFQQTEHDGAKSIYKWWNDEYRLVAVCVIGAIILGIIFKHYDRQPIPQLMDGDLDFDVIIVAMFTCVRVAMSGIVETSISQSAWIWVSEARQRRTNDSRARLEDFKIYDEASRGLWGSLYLLWRLRGSGILSVDVKNLDLECSGVNCTWPIVPTLAVCGECNPLDIRTICTDKSQTCRYSLPRGTSVEISRNAPTTERFKTAASEGIMHRMNSTTQTYISVFDVLWVMKSKRETKSIAQECALWFCMKSYNFTITESQLKQKLTMSWNTTRFELGNSAHGDEYVFVDIPAKDMNVAPESRYSISKKALAALRRFVDPIVETTYEKQYTIINFSSDWAEGIYNAREKLPEWINRFSISLTNEVRLHGEIRDKDQHRYTGRAYEMVQVIMVDWLWMLFPTGLIIISIYYLLHTIIRGARDGISVWKSDSLPMLFCRIDGSILAKVGDGMDVPNGLDVAVGNVNVCLLREDDGDWVFKPIESEESSSSSSSLAVFGPKF